MADAAIFTELTAITKDAYLPALNNQVNVETCPLMAEIRKEGVPASGALVTAAKIGMNGGTGFASEGGVTPIAGAQRYQDFKSTTKDVYTNIEISQKTIELATGGVASILNAYDAEIQSAKDSAMFTMGRALYGNGNGVLAKIKTVSNGKYYVDDARLLREGLTVDIFASKTATTKLDRLRFSYVSHLETDDGYEVTFETTPTETLDAGQVIVQQNTVPGTGMEITGIGAIFDPDINEIYGVKKSEKAWIKPLSKYLSSSDTFDNYTIRTMLRRAKNERGSDINMITMGDYAFDKYVTFLEQSNKYQLINGDMTLKGGFKAIKFAFGSKEIAIVEDPFMDPKTAYGLNTDEIVLHQTGWKFADKGGDAFTLLENKSVYRALLCNYAELMCNYPGGVFQITYNAEPTE